MNYMEGVQVDFEKLIEWSPPESVKDYENIIARYSFLIRNMRVGILLSNIDKLFN